VYPVSDYFNSLVMAPNREFDVKILMNGTEYNSNKVVEFELYESIVEGEDYTIGAAVPTRLDLTIKTEDIFPSNAEIKPYIKLYGDGASSEWMPFGVFYIDSRKYINDVWEFVCYDKLMLANQPWETELYLPATMKEVIEEICDMLEIQICPDTVIRAYEVPLMTHEFTMRQVIGYIAACHGANARINKDGCLEFVECKQLKGGWY
jgi:hypothetical protein